MSQVYQARRGGRPARRGWEEVVQQNYARQICIKIRATVENGGKHTLPRAAPRALAKKRRRHLQLGLTFGG